MGYTVRSLGYTGSASIGSTQLLVTGGSFSDVTTTSYLEMISTPPDATFAGRVRHADGTNSYSGQLDFDVHPAAMLLFTTSNGLFERNYSFDVGIYDGVTDWKMSGCKATSLSISGDEGGLLSASVSFIALRQKAAGSTPNVFIRDTAVPMGYWYSGSGSGNADLKSWTLSMNQDANCVYTNENTNEPDYIKVGLVDYLLSVTSYNALASSDTITIATDTFTLIGNMNNDIFNFGGLNDFSTYDYTFETASNDGKSDTLVIV